MAEPGHGWLGAHVFHRGDQDLLITGTVAPLCRELTRARLVQGWFFLRYWEGGPHVRVRLLAPDHAAEVRAAVLRACDDHFTRHPSPPGGWTQDEYAAVAARRALQERLTTWDDRLRLVDAVEFTPYRPEHHAYGHDGALHAVERHFVESSTIAARLLADRADRSRRAAAALALVMLAVAVCEPDAARAGVRLATARTPHSPSWTSFYEDRAADLHAQARLLWASAAAPPGAPSTDPLAAWLRSVRRLHAALTRLRERGAFAPTDALSPFAGLAQALHPDDPAVAQVVLRCAHLLCNRLGLHSTTEAQIAFLTTRTLTELHDEVTPR